MTPENRTTADSISTGVEGRLINYFRRLATVTQRGPNGKSAGELIPDNVVCLTTPIKY